MQGAPDAPTRRLTLKIWPRRAKNGALQKAREIVYLLRTQLPPGFRQHVIESFYQVPKVTSADIFDKFDSVHCTVSECTSHNLTARHVNLCGSDWWKKALASGNCTQFEYYTCSPNTTRCKTITMENWPQNRRCASTNFGIYFTPKAATCQYLYGK